MIEAGKKILQQFTGKATPDEILVDDLKKAVIQYPYSSAAHYLLAAKLQAIHGEDSVSQRVKTALYFSNPFWLQFVLQGDTGSEKAVVFPIADQAEEREPVPKQAKEIQPAADADTNIKTPVAETDFMLDTVEEEDLQVTKHETEEPGLFKLSKIIEQQLSEFKKPFEGEQVLPIKSHPFFTIDYFASQGIKAEALQQGKDLLTGKVKKFTEWLRDMKAVNPQPADLGTDPETEKLIETIAQTSNETKEVVTEAMADVLVKQGKMEKAIQLYKKLSFLNPGKSTYFAAKIEELKGI